MRLVLKRCGAFRDICTAGDVFRPPPPFPQPPPSRTSSFDIVKKYAIAATVPRFGQRPQRQNENANPKMLTRAQAFRTRKPSNRSRAKGPCSSRRHGNAAHETGWTTGLMTTSRRQLSSAFFVVHHHPRGGRGAACYAFNSIKAPRGLENVWHPRRWKTGENRHAASVPAGSSTRPALTERAGEARCASVAPAQSRPRRSRTQKVYHVKSRADTLPKIAASMGVSVRSCSLE